MVYETQIYKDKLDKKKVELYEFRKKTEELLKFKVLYESIKQKDAEKETLQIEELTKKELLKQAEQKSIIGHIEGTPSIFSEVTCEFLDLSDILKIACLNKNIQGIFLRYNSSIVM